LLADLHGYGYAKVPLEWRQHWQEFIARYLAQREVLAGLVLVMDARRSMTELDRRMRNAESVLRHMIVRTDLDHKRAEKLARRNPKKERVRPAQPTFTPEPAAPPAAEPRPETPAE